MTPTTTSAFGSEGVVYFFYGEECSHCKDVTPFIINMSQKYPEANIMMLEVWDNETNKKTVASVHMKLNRKFIGVPEVVIGDDILLGTHDILTNMEQQIRHGLGKQVQHEIKPNRNFPDTIR